MSVPPRWRHCPRKGKIIADKFLAFKTPLSTEYDRDLEEAYRFYPSMLVAYIGSMGRRMGLVVDLTKTDRYYDKSELIHSSIGHHKIICEGYGAAPTSDQVQTFRTICKHFFAEHPGEIVGVHCTHGFNRTGFLISAYLVEEECWDLEAAVATFSVARPPGIYKQHYLEELAARYSDGHLGSLSAPALPEWCFEEEEVVSGGEEGGGSEGGMKRKHPESGGGSNRKRKMERNNENAQFAVQVDGVEIVWGDVRREVQETCQQILNWDGSGFPGSQPVSMDVQNIRFISERPYRVSWKADGTRYLLYIKERGQVYLVDRDNSVFSAPAIRFPARKKPGSHVTETLADSELVIDKDKGAERPRLLIYDIMQFEGNKDVSKCDHQRRLLCVEKELIQPREEAAASGVLDKHMEPFSIRFKQFWDVSEARMILDKWMPKLTHESDGLIFNPLLDSYVAGRCDNLLKWKPEELNSVDFKLNIITRQQEGMLKEKIGQLFVGSGGQFAELDLKLNKDAKQYNGRIVECTMDKETNKWLFLRVRDDKSFPNAYETAKSVCMSIRQPVTKDWLLYICEKHHYGINQVDISNNSSFDKDSKNLMPPPKSRPIHDK